MSARPQRTENLPKAIPIFPLPGAILLPRANLPLNIFEPRYLAMIDDVLSQARLIGMIQPRDDADELYAVGCVGRLTSLREIDDERYLIELTGISRFTVIRELSVKTPYRQAEVDYVPFKQDLRKARAGSIDRDLLLQRLKRYLDHNRLEADWKSISSAPDEPLVNALAMIAPVHVAEKQALLEAEAAAERAQILITLIDMALAEGPGQDSTVQ